MMQKKIDKEIKIVVDPTLLLTRQDWDEIAITSNNYSGYIFVYLLGNNLEHREKIKKIAQILNLRIVTIPHVHMRYEVNDEKFADVEVYDAGPREFIGWIKNANMIITDSFHGTVFSILYEKSFWTFRRNIDSDPKNMNSRLYSLFENLGIQNRFLEEIDDLNNFDMLIEKINYEVVNKHLDILRKDSGKWLKSALKESEEKL